mgnify:FL=1
MNFIRKSYLAAFSLLAMAGVFTGCEEEENVAKAVMASANSLSFPGEEATEQIITVYSDAEWTADVPEWVSIEPTTGSGTTDVTVSVNANMRDGALDNPRRSELVFHGKTLMSRATVIVNQSGDKFRDVKNFTISEVAASDDETVVIVPTAQVAALTSKGFVATDGSSAVYVLSSEEVAVGDAVEIWGTKGADKELPAITNADKVIVSSNSAVSYPSAKDIRSEIDTYKAESREFIQVSGLLKGSSLKLDGEHTVSVAVLDAHSSLEIAQLNNHNVVLYGYFAGLVSNTINVIAAKFDDKGAAAGTGSLPVEWYIGVKGDNNINFAETFPKSGTIAATKNEGEIKYVYDLTDNNGNNKFKLDVESGNPRCTGPWPGDYWDFATNASAKAGETVEISFETRTSATGHKYWRLEYLDGTEWKVAGTALKTSEPGSEIVYTHIMNADGKTNVFVDTQVTYENATSMIEFRFVCAANWQAKGGALGARNGGSARLTVTDPADPSRQPTIKKVSGAGGKTAVFEDDFSWVDPIVSTYNAAVPDKPIGDTIGDKNKGAEAPNVYNAALKEAFFKLFDEKGYEDMYPSEEVIYLQPGYLKFGRTGGHNTSLRLPKLNLDAASDIDIEFDFAAMAQGSGTIDDTKLVVVVEGDGEFANGTKYSDLITQNQGKDELFWTHAKTTVKGATANTRLVIVMYRVLEGYETAAYTGNYKYNVSGAGRFFLDNIKITK